MGLNHASWPATIGKRILNVRRNENSHRRADISTKCCRVGSTGVEITWDGKGGGVGWRIEESNICCHLPRWSP